MAFVVRRPRGRWEIRESFMTKEGPRARTLASFKTLTPQILDRVLRTAQGPADRNELIRSARRAGATYGSSPADVAAATLIRRLAFGDDVRPGLRTILAAHLNHDRGVDDSFTMWIGAPYEERAAALVDLLNLTDSLPKPRRQPLTFPRLTRAGLR